MSEEGKMTWHEEVKKPVKSSVLSVVYNEFEMKALLIILSVFSEKVHLKPSRLNASFKRKL
jgi:hypothetical protein